MSNPYLDRKAKHAIGKAGRKSEARLTKQLGGRGRPASGAMEGAKGDIDLGSFLVESKSTTGKSMSIQFEWLAKIGREARREGKSPALTVVFVTEDGRSVVDGEWCLVPMYVFRELTE